MRSSFHTPARDLRCQSYVGKQAKKAALGHARSVSQPVVPAFGAVLRDAQQRKGFSLSQIMRRMASEGAPLSKSELGHTLNGHRRNPAAAQMLVLARVLGLDPIRLLDILLWSRRHPDAATVPEDLQPLEGLVLVSHAEEDFVVRVRKLRPAQAREIFKYLQFIESGEKKGGPRKPRDTF